MKVILFGDPFDGSVVGKIPAAKVKVFCYDTDDICDGGIIVKDVHHTVSSVLFHVFDLGRLDANTCKV